MTKLFFFFFFLRLMMQYGATEDATKLQLAIR